MEGGEQAGGAAGAHNSHHPTAREYDLAGGRVHVREIDTGTPQFVLAREDDLEGQDVHDSHELWYCNGTRARPRLRGVLHEVFLFATPVLGLHMLLACDSALKSFAAVLHILSSMFCYGASSQYHRRNWTLKQEVIASKVDYLAIFVILGFQFAPVALLLIPRVGVPILAAQAVVLTVGSVVTLNTPPYPLCFPIVPSRLAMVALFMAMGSLGFFGMPAFLAHATFNEAACVWAMVVVCIVAGLVYALRWPDPFPDTFGFHEVFHLAVCVAQVLAYAVNLSVIERT